MTPLGFEKSDGLQNLTESLLAARLLPPGVYLVIHSQVFPIDRVRKDRKRARFVWTGGASQRRAEESCRHSATVTSIGAVSAKVPHATLRVTLRMLSLG